MHSLRPHHTLPIRAINAVGRATAAVGLRLPNLAEDGLLAAARAETKLADFGPEGFRAGLRTLLQSLETEAELTTVGRMMARGQILNLLTNRLQLTHHRKRHPEIADEPIRRPLFVLGLPRTGTTILYGLLAQDPAVRSPLAWEVSLPCPPPEAASYASDPRIRRADEQFARLAQLAPGFDAIHPIGSKLPQECVAIFAHEFKSVQFEAAFDVPSYQNWLETQDMRATYRFHREFLQHLQSRCPGERWVLKSPGHLPFVDTLLGEYPDAMIVQTHRDPVEVIGSVSSLECILRGAASDAIDPHAIGAQQVDLWSRQIARGMQARRNAGREERFFDVQFREFLADPFECVKKIYAHFSLPFSNEVEARMRSFYRDNARDKHGVHRYRLSDFGIDRDEAARHFAEYYDAFQIPRGTPA
jgi:hypothetical protein